MTSRPVRFPGTHGAELAAIIDLPSALPPRATALFAPCFTCSKDLKAIVHICRTLAEAGIAVLRLDFTGLGSSGGNFSDTTLADNIGDLQLAAAHLAQEWPSPSLLIGHSFGGVAALLAAKKIPSCRAVAVIATPADPRYLEELFAESLRQIHEQGEALIQVAGRDVLLKNSFVDQLAVIDLPATIGSLDLPLLVLHSPVDRVVPIAHGERIFAAARHPRSIVSLGSADHLLTNPDDARYAGSIIAAWLERSLTPSR
ncbi:MAG TPA: alpha/beta fold hydrolase [Geobacterales bacterium]|nr:alpha/beta fold hydrolase [Geobacterales bacterium]